MHSYVSAVTRWSPSALFTAKQWLLPRVSPVLFLRYLLFFLPSGLLPHPWPGVLGWRIDFKWPLHHRRIWSRFTSRTGESRHRWAWGGLCTHANTWLSLWICISLKSGVFQMIKLACFHLKVKFVCKSTLFSLSPTALNTQPHKVILWPFTGFWLNRNESSRHLLLL